MMCFTGILAQTSAAPETHSQLYYLVASLAYGIVEGLTEFLPVSSTAHLRIVEALTPGIALDSGYWKMYSVVIQLGAILTVPLLFWNRIVTLLQSFPRGDTGRKTPLTHPLGLVILGFLVTAGPCYFADKYIGKNLESLWVIGGALLLGGIVMWVVDVMCSRPRINRMEEMGILDAIWIGAVQILSAVFPGTSRSMSTIAAGQVFGLSRATALEYSFFLSMPTMFAATGFKLLQTLLHRAKTAEAIAEYHAPPGQWLVLLVGFVVSFIVAWLVNRWFIHWVQKHGFVPFAVYRLLAGVGVLIWAWQS
ncbi:MAG: undecaprenyl-diphosphate phosphatase [Phycisphaerae bacterium]